jgi:hypothetical protein
MTTIGVERAVTEIKRHALGFVVCRPGGGDERLPARTVGSHGREQTNRPTVVSKCTSNTRIRDGQAVDGYSLLGHKQTGLKCR